MTFPVEGLLTRLLRFHLHFDWSTLEFWYNTPIPERCTHDEHSSPRSPELSVSFKQAIA